MVMLFLESYSAAKEWCANKGREEQSATSAITDVRANFMGSYLELIYHIASCYETLHLRAVLSDSISIGRGRQGDVEEFLRGAAHAYLTGLRMADRWRRQSERVRSSIVSQERRAPVAGGSAAAQDRQ